MEKDMRERMDGIKDKVKTRSLYIARVPEKAKKEFMELAECDFESDYGMTLKYLCDLYKGCFPSGHELIEEEIRVLSSRVDEIENKSTKTIKMVSGKEIKLKRGEKKNGSI